MRNIVSNATKQTPSTVGLWTLALVVVLLAVWILGMSGIIHLPLALVWILPFTCIVVGAVVVLWEAGAFSD